ncbi:MAG: hypothetical protein GY913_20260 [Proteobacteria bacterium]|nr:hypothetical protein [Pseudomonadota bacterium]MCP4919241.1 hypothetical protein [Pseudomonadota bacterium]
MILLTLLTGCSELETPVRATLDDGQVLMGMVSTPTLLLNGGLGAIPIPIDDIGEVTPVEGGDLAGSGNHVTVWLRNGSELRGEWARPEIQMGIEAGGIIVPVDVTTDELLRLQMLDGQVWPEGVVYRVRTSHGDDFLIDPELTQIELQNDMGLFAPFLSECISVAPIEGSDDWRIELATGTVLVGPLADDAITFALPMGPATVDVPLDVLVGLDRQDWGTASRDWLSTMDYERAAAPVAAEPMVGYGAGAAENAAWETGMIEDEIQRAAPRARLDSGGWFTNDAMRDFKATQKVESNY